MTLQDLKKQALWQPDPATVASAWLTDLARRMGVRDYDALLAMAIERPDEFWRHTLEQLGIEWYQPYDRFVDLSAGPQAPRWFVGGRINWVHNALKWRHRQPDRVALIAESEVGAARSLSYAQLHALTMRAAGGLERLGVRRGDRVGILLGMGVEAVASLLALTALGAIAVPLFTGFGSDAIAARLKPARARMLIAASSFMRRGRDIDAALAVADAAAQVRSLEHIVWVGGHPPDMSSSVPSSTWEALLDAPPLEAPVPMDPNDPFMIIYTSGTTGAPKGTVHTHGSFALKIAQDAAHHFEIRSGSRWLWPSDLGWIVGPLTVVGAFTLGATLVCYDGAPDAPDWSRMGRLIEAHAVTHFGASPTLIRALAANAATALNSDLVRLKVLIAAGEVLDAEHFEWFFRAFGRGRLPVINYTGGTEVSGGLLANVVLRAIRPYGFNSSSPGVAVDVTDPAGQSVQAVPGELTVDRPFVGMTHSFWEDHDRYVETYWSRLPGRWVHGDLVRRDADGYYTLLGRSDDTLKIAGKRVGPAEVEAVVLEGFDVAAAAAVGLPDESKGQRLVVVVIPRVGADGVWAEQIHPDDIGHAVEIALGRPFRPAAVYIVPDLPRTRNGKIMRRVIRNVLSGDPPGDVSSLDNPSAVDLLAKVRAQTG